MSTPKVHPEIEHLVWLLGTWVGKGDGEYPTIEPFSYTEQSEFSHVGKPFLAYSQKTRHGETGLPLHAETGYLRPVGLDRVELLIAQPSGIMEIYDGTVSGTTVDLVATTVVTSPTAKEVTEVTRRFTFDQATATLSYTLAMAAVGLELQHHLEATLKSLTQS